mgnify:CR=1 FL=1
MEINKFYIAGEFVTPNGKEKIDLSAFIGISQTHFIQIVISIRRGKSYNWLIDLFISNEQNVVLERVVYQVFAKFYLASTRWLHIPNGWE